jgi:YVTN family beta-propeller protein
MSLVIFGGSVSMITTATPSTGWVVAYDTDGIIKQKDSAGVITPIGGGPTAGSGSTASLSQVLQVGNNSDIYSIIMGTSTSIRSARGGGRIELDKSGTNSISITTDNGLQSEHGIILENSNSSIFSNNYKQALKLWDGTGNTTLYNSSGQGGILLGVSTGSVVSTELDEVKIAFNAFTFSTTSNTPKQSVFIGTKNSKFEAGVENSVILGGQGLTASQSDSVYVPDLYIQNQKGIKTTDSNEVFYLKASDGSTYIDRNSGLFDKSWIWTNSNYNSKREWIEIGVNSDSGYGTNSVIQIYNSKGPSYSWFAYSQLILDKENLKLESVDLDTTGDNINIVLDASINSAEIEGPFGTFRGIEYVQDYSASYSLRSLVDKDYVDTQISSANSPTLFSVLSSGNNSNNQNIIMGTSTYIKSANGGGRIDLDFISNVNTVLISTDDGGISNAYIKLQNGDIELQSINNSTFIFNEALVQSGDGKGIQYDSDYSSTFDTHSLIDKLYVDTGTNSIWNYISNCPTGSGVANYVPKWTAQKNISGTSSMWISEGVSDNSLLTSLPVGTAPYDVAFDSYNKRLYVANSSTNNITVYDSINYLIIGTISVGTFPNAVEFDSENNRVYVANRNSANVTIIDTLTNTITGTVSVGTFPVGLNYDSVNNRVYVACQTSNQVSVIDTTTLTNSATFSTSTPRGLAYDPVNNNIYVAGVGPDKVACIDASTGTITATVSVGTNPYGLAYDSLNQRIYVSNYVSNNVSVIDAITNTVISTIAVGSNPEGIEYDALNNRIYVTNTSSSNVSVISSDTNTVITTITLSGVPRGLAYDFLNSRIFVTNTSTNTVQIISTMNRKDGFVGVNTINPISELDVRGKITTEEFRLTTGANSGYFLVSDTLGNATWQYPIIEIIGGTGLTGSGTAGVITIVVELEENGGLTFSSIGEITTDFTTLASSLQGSGLTANAGVLDINANNGITIINDVVQISDTAAGNGLTFSSGIFDINTSNGLTIISDSVQIADTAAGNGLTFSSGIFDINTSNGLTIISDSVQVADTISGKGLTFSSGVIDINLGLNSGLTFSGDDVIVDTNIAGNGLDISSGVLTVNTSEITTSLSGSGLTANGSTLDVNVGNGLELVSDQIYLGGTLSQNTTINASNYGLYFEGDSVIDNYVNDPNSFPDIYGQVNLTSQIYDARIGSISGNTFSRVTIQSNGLILENQDDSGSQVAIQVSLTTSYVNDGSSNNRLVVIDDLSQKGLVYSSDYTSNFTTHSLVTKGYVDSVAGSIGATNGISELSSGIIGLGGTLSQTTIIDTSTYDFTINSSSSEIELNRISTTYPTVTNTFRLEDKYAIIKSESSIYSSFIELSNEDNGQAMADIKIDLGTYSNIIRSTNNSISTVVSSIDGSGSYSSVWLFNSSQSLTSGDLTTNNHLIITDQLGNKGLVYDEDYSLNFSNNSLVTKSYVDSNSTSKYSITRGFTASVTETITHNLGTDEIIVQAYDSTGVMVIPGTVQINGTNDVDITFSSTLSSIKIIVIG